MHKERDGNSTIEGGKMSGIYVHATEHIEENENKIPQRIVLRRRGRVVRGRLVMDPFWPLNSLNEQPFRPASWPLIPFLPPRLR